MNDRTDARQEAGQRIRTLLGPDGELCRNALAKAPATVAQALIARLTG
ncbi:hypothetical protein [Streptomyces sp. Ncost-T10-10d]|nr:hypothetical protein [Streptomyces sp. Ncost-T10-10d]SCF82485.1 hypothetical protein GA0115254_11835 [Streptomyces sp. Ncost-T10-10d]